MAVTMCCAPLGLGLGGCLAGGDGIDLDLVFPADPALAPDKEEITHVSLVYWEPGKPTNRVTRALEDIRDNPIDEFTPGQTLRMAVELRTATQRLIGFGRVPEPIEIGADGSASFSVEVRRPFVYLGGDAGIQAIDATQDASLGLGAYLSPLGPSLPAQVAVPTYDGKLLAAVLTRPLDPNNPESPLISELMVMGTDDHAPATGSVPVALRAPAADLAISADARYAIVAHETSQDGNVPGGLSIVDLQAALAGQAVVHDLREGSVGRVSVGVEQEGHAFALVDRLDGLACTPGASSTMVEILLEETPRVARRVTLGTQAQDLAVADDGSFVVVADSCKNMLWRVPNDGNTPAPLRTELPDVSALALWNNTIWTVTSTRPPATPSLPGNAEIRVLSLDLEGNTVADIPLPPMALALETPGFSSDGQLATLQVTAESVYAFDLAVAPGAGAIALLMENQYAVDEKSQDGSTIIPEMDIVSREYLLVDVTTATAVQHVVDECDISRRSSALVADWRCTQTPDPEAQGDFSHEVRGLSVLYGSR